MLNKSIVTNDSIRTVGLLVAIESTGLEYFPGTALPLSQPMPDAQRVTRSVKKDVFATKDSLMKSWPSTKSHNSTIDR